MSKSVRQWEATQCTCWRAQGHVTRPILSLSLNVSNDHFLILAFVLFACG
jgi:hypothetical protein